MPQQVICSYSMCNCTLPVNSFVVLQFLGREHFISCSHRKESITAAANMGHHYTLQGRMRRHLEISHKCFFTNCACVVAHYQLGSNIDIFMFYERKALFIVVWEIVKQFNSIYTYTSMDSGEMQVN